MANRAVDLTDRATHFDFGKNWSNYSKLIDPARLESAIESVRSLVGDASGKTFLDIGSGSGLMSLAALHLGAAHVTATDIDEDSTATTRSVLESFEDPSRWTAERISVFDLRPEKHGTFDIVYSWGVLHHTGKMWPAIEAAARMVKPGGLFALALYEKTPLCGFWKVEKRAYMKAGRLGQKLIRGLYVAAYGAGLAVTGRNPFKRIQSARERGMDPILDAHDWLGGYPYESCNKEEVSDFLSGRGFAPVLEKPVPVRAAGLFGSGCSEYVYRRVAGADAQA
jgi:SAM-dependent methyltransferase